MSYFKNSNLEFFPKPRKFHRRPIIRKDPGGSFNCFTPYIRCTPKLRRTFFLSCFLSMFNFSPFSSNHNIQKNHSQYFCLSQHGHYYPCHYDHQREVSPFLFLYVYITRFFQDNSRSLISSRLTITAESDGPKEIPSLLEISSKSSLSVLSKEKGLLVILLLRLTPTEQPNGQPKPIWLPWCYCSA
jgi:hypothetical protein